MNPVWHALWLAIETAAWFVIFATLACGVYVLFAGMSRRRLVIMETRGKGDERVGDRSGMRDASGRAQGSGQV